MKPFKIEGEYIELMALLKATGIAETGGHAKHIIDSKEVHRNGQLETRRRAKLLRGDIILVSSRFKINLI